MKKEEGKRWMKKVLGLAGLNKAKVRNPNKPKTKVQTNKHDEGNMIPLFLVRDFDSAPLCA